MYEVLVFIFFSNLYIDKKFKAIINITQKKMIIRQYVFEKYMLSFKNTHYFIEKRIILRSF